jgi:hypothetical protein
MNANRSSKHLVSTGVPSYAALQARQLAHMQYIAAHATQQSCETIPGSMNSASIARQCMSAARCRKAAQHARA